MKTADIPDVAAAAAQPAMRHEPDRPAPAPEPEIAEASEALATAEAPARWSPPAAQRPPRHRECRRFS